MNSQLRILYIEDNPDNQRLVKRVLTRHGYILDIADEGTSGLELAQTATPDLILMDINLPGLTGYELATKFKSLPQLSQTPIVAITANTMVGDRERALAAGCDGYISKPIDPRELPQQIASYLGGAREALPTQEAPSYMREYSQQLVQRLEDHIKELESANERLVELDRAKSEFLATISHELRTPLTVIHGYIDLMNMKALGPLTDHQADAVKLIRANSYRLLRHINDLIYLQQVRSSELDVAETDVVDLLKVVCNDLQSQATARSVSLTCSYHGVDSLMLMLDDMGVQNALRHLIDNALLYSKPQGQVQVDLLTTHDQVLIVVKDTGIGIAPEDQHRIFEAFVRVDDSLAELGGAGLGLVIAQHVAQAHQGKINLTSAPGKGSTFTFVLPR